MVGIRTGAEESRAAWGVGIPADVGSTVGKGGEGVDPALQATINTDSTAKKLANTGWNLLRLIFKSQVRSARISQKTAFHG